MTLSPEADAFVESRVVKARSEGRHSTYSGEVDLCVKACAKPQPLVSRRLAMEIREQLTIVGGAIALMREGRVDRELNELAALFEACRARIVTKLPPS